jgi:type IX secretion system PorP/SprF family membrane protein
MAFTDKSGNGVLQNNFLALSTAYHKALDENGFHQIGLGFQGTYVNKRLDIASLKFESMLRSDGFTGLMDESFSSNQIKLSYFDMNLGVLYNGTTDGSNNFYLGASMYHVNHPKETFKQGNYLLDPRVTIQAGGMVPVGEYNAFHFSANHSRQANATNTVIGGAYMINVSQDLGNPTNLYLGSWYRFGDAIIPYVGLEFGEFQLGASYDVNTSSLKPASNMRGGAEISLIYIKKHTDPNAKKLNCPKF